MRESFYLVAITFRDAFGFPVVYNTFAFATTAENAANDAYTKTLPLLPPGSTIENVRANAVKTELIEEIAERVLGWTRP
jgi:hypothetical protein